MPIDIGAIGAAALAAAKQPLWAPPAPTELGPQITTLSQEGWYHPRLDVVKAALAPLTQAAREQALQARVNWLQQRKAATETALAKLGVPTDIPATLRPSEIAPSDWPLKRAGIRVRRLSFRLKAGQKLRDKVEPTDTDRAVVALQDATVISAAAAHPDKAADLLLQLRCLADVYARWEIAARLTSEVVDDQLAMPALSNAEMLARILTYFRIEGDFSIPPEDDTLEATDPGADSSHIPLPPGRTRFSPFLKPSAYMYCVTWLVRPESIPIKGTTIDLSDPATRAELADSSFTVALGGLDILWDPKMQEAAEQLFPDDPNPFKPTDRFDWPALNRRIPPSRPFPEARQDAAADFAARRALIKDRLKGPLGSQASRTTAIDRVAYSGPYSGAAAHYAALVLSEGVRYFNRLTYGPTRFGPGAPTRLPEIIVYLLYHMGDKSKTMLASAAAHALQKSSKSSHADSLRSAMTAAGLDQGLQKVLQEVRHASDPKAAQKAKDNWKSIATLFANSAVMMALASYIRHEDDAVWKSWVNRGPDASSPRGNCIGYAELYEYLLAQIRGT